ncbi:hypothetical protein [Longispora urticae]
MRSDQSHRVRRATGPRRAVALVAMIAAALAFGGTLPSTTTLAGGPGDSVRQGVVRLAHEDRDPAAPGADDPTRNCAVAVTTDAPTVGKGPDVPAVTGDAGSAPRTGVTPHGDGSVSGPDAPPLRDGSKSGPAATQRCDGAGRGSLRPWSLLRQLGASLLRSWF